MNKEKDFLEYASVWLPIIFASISMIISGLSVYYTKTSSKEIFINNLRDKIKSAKQKILSLEKKDYSQNDKLITINMIHDLLLYQGYQKEKEKYLSKVNQEELFKLQEEIEDNVACILVNTDIDINKNEVKNSLDNFINRL